VPIGAGCLSGKWGAGQYRRILTPSSHSIDAPPAGWRILRPWKIESGFKELKQDIGSQSSQCRNAQAVMNHLNFCLMASTITWIYADRLKADPERRHKVKGRTSYAFSDVRRIIAEAALHDDFDSLCPKPNNSPKNSLVAVLLRMVA